VTIGHDWDLGGLLDLPVPLWPSLSLIFRCFFCSLGG
jgi:hypothetical protein